MNRVCAAITASATAFCLITPTSAQESRPETVRVNRTVPQSNLPETELEFSAKPTAHEISRARVFEEPLVPIGGEPTAEENSALVVALTGYTRRHGLDDFSSVTDFLEKRPNSPWRAGLLTCLGLEYFQTAYYSRALKAWEEAWALGQTATDVSGKFLADRAVCELAGLYSRLGRMNELAELLKAIENRPFIGGANERINIAREALSMMQNHPEISFRCGPMALQSILRSDGRLLASCSSNAMKIFDSASTQKGFSLLQVAELSKEIGLNYQMAFLGSPLTRPSDTLSPTGGEGRGEGAARSTGDFIVPSVVHWKVGHYAAIVRQEGDRYLLEDPTFGNTVWATRGALEAEASGYFLIPSGDLLHGWRSVDANESTAIWGKGVTGGNDPDQYTCNNEQTASCSGSDCKGMAISSVHLMLANLQIRDTPVGYTPPVGPAVDFTLRYNHREYLQSASESTNIFGPNWTHDWNVTIKDNTFSPLADVKYLVGGGGARTFRGFDTNTQTFALQQYDQTLLKRISPSRYEMMWPDGSKRVFSLRISPTTVLLTEVVDPAGNAVTLAYDGGVQGVRLIAITDAIGQVTTLSYENTNNVFLITKVTDPFGRVATFDYVERTVGWVVTGSCTNIVATPIVALKLDKITDVIGLTSRVTYETKTYTYVAPNLETGGFCTNDYNYNGGFITSLTTPYGVTAFTAGQVGTNANSRVVETTFPDGSRERVEYNQSSGLIPASDPPALIPSGVFVFNSTAPRNTYYWSRTAAASSYGIYSKAKIYHWLHTNGGGLTSGILECIKEPLENRVWFNYPDQNTQGGSAWVGSSDHPTKVARVLEDGQTQLYTYAYDRFGNVTNSIDPVGRTFSYLYATNGIDLLEVRQTRAGKNELLSRATHNVQHLPLSTVNASGQTNLYTYNARGQPLTHTNPKGETTTYAYGVDGQLQTVDGPLPGTDDTILFNHDALYRVRSVTDSSGYRINLDYDDMDRITRLTYPDTTFEQFTYDRLDVVTVRDRAGRQTFFEYDAMRQVKKTIDPLGRVTLFDWCRCGQIKSLTDPMGRTTSWLTDVQGRNIAKQYCDGSQVTYQYENASSRLKHVIDEKQQVTQYAWNRDDTLKSIAYFNTTAPTPSVSFTYDPDYARALSMTDGTGTTLYSYNPITGSPALGAGALASVDGPLPNDTITYSYDKLGRSVHRAINGVGSLLTYDAAGRVTGVTNALGAFTYDYDGDSARVLTNTFPTGQRVEFSYGNTNQDLMLQRITHSMSGSLISQFLYGRDLLANRIATWSQQTGVQPPSLHNFGYDAANQLLSVTVTNSGNLVGTFAYSYNPAANRLTEQIGTSNYAATYNALNEINTSTAPGITRSNEWDALDRLVAVNVGNRRTEFIYDGLSRRVAIRQLVNGSEVSHRRFVWGDSEISEERDGAGAIVKRFFPQGMMVETGPVTGGFFYTRDHLGSIRELTDTSGTLRGRYAYDPYGRQTKLMGDLEADFGFAGMFWSVEADLSLTLMRAYDPELGRWLSRDPLPGAEMSEGPNLYAYVGNDPVNRSDPYGLGGIINSCTANPVVCSIAMGSVVPASRAVQQYGPSLQRFSPLLPRVPQAVQCGQNVAARAPVGLEFTVLELEHVPLVVEALPGLQNLQRSINAWIPAAQAIRYNPHPQTGVPLWQMFTTWMNSASRVVPWDKPFASFADQFQKISQALADKLGIPLNQAEAMLARMAWGINPVD